VGAGVFGFLINLPVVSYYEVHTINVATRVGMAASLLSTSRYTTVLKIRLSICPAARLLPDVAYQRNADRDQHLCVTASPESHPWMPMLGDSYRNRLRSVSDESSRRAMSARSSYVVDRPASVICK